MKKSITIFALLALITVSTSVTVTKVTNKATVTADSDTGGREDGSSKPMSEI